MDLLSLIPLVLIGLVVWVTVKSAMRAPERRTTRRELRNAVTNPGAGTTVGSDEANLLRVLLVTTESIPGREVSDVLGLVTGVGHPRGPVWGSTAGRSTSAAADAEIDLRRKAIALGADAVVSISQTAYAGGARTMGQAVGVQMSGTAVRLAPKPTA